MGLIAFLKYAVNNTIGTSYFKPLDELLGATLILRGSKGTTFKVVNSEGLYPEFTVELTEKSKVYSGIEYVHYVPVFLGTYVVTVSVDTFSTDVTINAELLGKKYLVEYLFTLQEFTATGDMLIPGTVDAIYVTAAAAGGGGSSGYDGYEGAGGSGGGGGDYIINQKFPVTPSSTLSITVGVGGSGGTGVDEGANAGKAGGSTVIGDLITLAGGKGGSKPTSSSAVGAAGAGSGNGGAGGKGSASDGSNGSAGKLSGGASGGTGGTGNTSGGSGGGGGGSLGKGGNGGFGSSTSEVATAGDKGGGGGGGAGGNYSSSIMTRHNGGKGGNGYVKICRGVKAS